MNCQACRIEIEESETSESLSAEARVHTGTCSSCRRLREEHLALRRLVGSLDRVAAPPDFDLRLRARLAAGINEEQPRLAWLRLLPGGLSFAGVAACLLLVVLAAVVYRQVRQPGPETLRPAELVSNGASKTNDPPATPEDAAHTSNQAQDNLAREGSPNPRDNSSGGSRVAVVGTSDGPRVLRSRTLGVTGAVAATTAAARPDASASGADRIISSDSAVYNPPPLITPTNIYNPAVDPMPYIVLPLRPSAQPMTFFMKGWDGAAHPVPLKLVTFGSEKLIEQGEDTRADVWDAADIW